MNETNTFGSWENLTIKNLFTTFLNKNTLMYIGKERELRLID